MDVSGAVLLYTLAGLMVTFAGFSTLLLVIRQAAGSRLSVLDRYLAKTVLTNSLVLTAAALLPPLLALYGIAEAAIWKIAAVCFAPVMLALLLSFPHRRRKAVGKGPPPMVLRDLCPARLRRHRCDAGQCSGRLPTPGCRLHHRLDREFLRPGLWLRHRHWT